MEGKGLVIEGIECVNLGRKTESEHVSSQNPFLKFEIESVIHKTETKKHVGSHVFFDDSIRFDALTGDVLTVNIPIILQLV